MNIKMKTNRYFLLVFSLLIILSSCSTMKQLRADYQPQPINERSILRKSTLDSLSMAHLSEDTTCLMHWQQFYKDILLQRLIREALVHNSDMEIARLRIQEAAASLKGVRGLLQPTVNISTGGTVNSFKGEKPAATYSLGPAASWEVDIFNRKGNNIKAAAASVDEKKAYAKAVETQLIATVARSYYTLEMLDAKKKVTEKTIHSWQQQINTERALMAAGETDNSSILQAEASKLAAEALLPQIQQQTVATENSLCALLGRPSESIPRDKFFSAELSSSLINHIPIVALATRPDVRQAEAQLRQAFYQTQVARSAFYPSLSLSGNAGWTNNGSVGVTNPGSVIWQATASLLQPLLANGQNKMNLEIAKSEQQQALVNFRQKVLDAGNEVNNALNSVQYSEKIIALQEQQREKLHQTIHAAEAQMRYGEGNSLQILIARQSLLDAEITLLNSQYDLIESYISLFQAL